jgi:dipeptidyl aminopeptidase/acylaminoacyl peptidase
VDFEDRLTGPIKKIAVLVSLLAALILLVPTVAVPMIHLMETHHQFLLVHGVNGQTRRVEIYWQKPSVVDGKNQKYPAIIYVHGMQKGHKPGGLGFVNAGILSSDAKRGFFSVTLSLPGYGQSDGHPDFCGAESQASLSSALSYVSKRPDIDPDHIGIVGISCGATVAGMVATRSHVSALVLISGFYDFREMVQKWQTTDWPLPPAIKKELEQNVVKDGGIESASAVRSLMPHVLRLTMPILLISGGHDHIVDVRQSERLHRLLDRQGTPNVFLLDGGAKHNIPVQYWRKKEERFLDARLLDLSPGQKH